MVLILEERKLYPQTKALLEASDEDRIYEIKSEHFIPHYRVQKVLQEMDDLMNHPPTHRMPNRLLLGKTNNGKSMAVLKFLKANPPEINPDGEAVIVPVLYVLMPAVPKERAFYLKILETLGTKHKTYAPTTDLGSLARRALSVIGLRLLIIDEIHNVLGGNSSERKEILRIIREMCNELKVPIFGCGTPDALSAIAIDDQLANRFVPIALPNWKPNNETRALLNSIEMFLPLKKASGLSQPDILKKILSLSEGTIGEIIALVRLAAIDAIKKKTEQITLSSLEEIDYVPPSIRREQAERLLGINKKKRKG